MLDLNEHDEKKDWPTMWKRRKESDGLNTDLRARLPMFYTLSLSASAFRMIINGKDKLFKPQLFN